MLKIDNCIYNIVSIKIRNGKSRQNMAPEIKIKTKPPLTLPPSPKPPKNKQSHVMQISANITTQNLTITLHLQFPLRDKLPHFQNISRKLQYILQTNLK